MYFLDKPSSPLATSNDQCSRHHIAFEIKGMPERITYLATQGGPLLQRGDYTGGRYAYIDSAEPLGVILELLENDR